MLWALQSYHCLRLVCNSAVKAVCGPFMTFVTWVYDLQLPKVPMVMAKELQYYEAADGSCLRKDLNSPLYWRRTHLSLLFKSTLPLAKFHSPLSLVWKHVLRLSERDYTKRRVVLWKRGTSSDMWSIHWISLALRRNVPLKFQAWTKESANGDVRFLKGHTCFRLIPQVQIRVTFSSGPEFVDGIKTI